MASFGRRPPKGEAGADSCRQQAAAPSAGRESFRRMLEETEDRERFEREHHEAEERAKEPRGEEKVPTQAPRSSAGPRPRVFMDIEVRGKLTGKLLASGRVEFELFVDTAPKAAENFRCLCTGERGRDLHYANCAFHRIEALMAHGGDITAGDGSGGKSIYGEPFPDEDLGRRHDGRGLLSMGNTGPGTNTSQFIVTFARAPQLDGKHVVFGKLLPGEHAILKEMEQHGRSSKNMVSIVSCGQVGAENRSLRERSRSPKDRRVPLSADGLRLYRRGRS